MTRQFTVPQYSHLQGQERYCLELVGLFVNNFQRTKPDIIWHYTSATNLWRMIASNEIWFRHVSALNDEREATHAAHLARVILSAYQTHNNLTPRETLLLQTLKSRLLSTRVQSIWFSASFSVLEDDNNLWSRYGDSGRGIAIGFHKEELIRYLSPSPSDRVVPFEIIYSQQEALHFGTLLLEHGLDAFRMDFSKYNDDSVAISNFAAQWAPLVDVFSIAFKEAEPWKVEQEFRLARLAFLPHHEPWKACKSAQSDSSCSALPIFSVVLGPEMTATERKQLRSDLLRSPHDNIVISDSKLSFRE